MGAINVNYSIFKYDNKFYYRTRDWRLCIYSQRDRERVSLILFTVKMVNDCEFNVHSFLQNKKMYFWCCLFFGYSDCRLSLVSYAYKFPLQFLFFYVWMWALNVGCKSTVFFRFRFKTKPIYLFRRFESVFAAAFYFVKPVSEVIIKTEKSRNKETQTFWDFVYARKCIHITYNEIFIPASIVCHDLASFLVIWFFPSPLSFFFIVVPFTQ